MCGSQELASRPRVAWMSPCSIEACVLRRLRAGGLVSAGHSLRAGHGIRGPLNPAVRRLCAAFPAQDPSPALAVLHFLPEVSP